MSGGLFSHGKVSLVPPEVWYTMGAILLLCLRIFYIFPDILNTICMLASQSTVPLGVLLSCRLLVVFRTDVRHVRCRTEDSAFVAQYIHMRHLVPIHSSTRILASGLARSSPRRISKPSPTAYQKTHVCNVFRHGGKQFSLFVQSTVPL